MATVDAEAVLNDKKSFGTKLSDLRKKSKELKMPWFPITVLIVLVICAVFAPWVAPHSPEDLDVLKGVSKIGPFESSENILGVDRLGRDMLSRLIYGARISAFGCGSFLGQSP